MPDHHRVRAWLAQHYQRPAIDQEWLADCCDWVASELGLDPARDLDQFVHNVEAQLLQSNLADSTVPGSGIDPALVASNPGPARPRPSVGRRSAARQKKTTGATPLLVEVRSITEIAHSAFSLLNTHQTRLDRADLGLAQEDNPEQHRDEDEGPVPRFPRGMLKFELSDGLTTFRAIEFRSLPQLELGTTPLGYKMILKSAPIRNGVAFLEPSNVILKGYRTEDHDINSEQVFLSILRKRLGRPDPPAAAQPQANPPEPAPAQPARPHQPPPANVDDMYVEDDVDPDVLREMAMQMDEAIDMQEKRRVSTHAPLHVGPPSREKKPATSSNDKRAVSINTKATSSLRAPPCPSSANTSSYFTTRSESKPIPDIDLSPRPAPPPDLEPDFDITWDIDEEPSEPSIKTRSSTSARSPAKHGSSKKSPSSPDPFDDFSFDMDVDESFLEQVGMIEQGALGTGTSDKGKGRAKDTGPTSVALARKMPSGLAVGTTRSAICSASASGAKPSTRMQGGSQRATSASSLSRSTESPVPRSTQSSDRGLPRDPSLLIISSSDDEALGVRRINPPNPARRRAHKERRMDQDVVADSDVIDISD